jgi:hypothetical protein
LRLRGERRILSARAGYKEAPVHSGPITALALVAALAGCATAPAGPQRAAGATCVVLFQNYDLAYATMSTPGGRRDRMSIPPALQLPVQLLMQSGCLTTSSDLAGMEAAGGPPIVDSGAQIVPTSLHVGVVTNNADEANAISFFAANGVAARTVGAAGLGRRIYIGPFGTQGALDGARDLALRAGFAAPYPASF